MKGWQLWFHTISLKFPFSYLWNSSSVGLTDNKSLVFVDKAKALTCVPDEYITEISVGLGPPKMARNCSKEGATAPATCQIDVCDV